MSWLNRAWFCRVYVWISENTRKGCICTYPGYRKRTRPNDRSWCTNFRNWSEHDGCECRSNHMVPAYFSENAVAHETDHPPSVPLPRERYTLLERLIHPRRQRSIEHIGDITPEMWYDRRSRHIGYHGRRHCSDNPRSWVPAPTYDEMSAQAYHMDLSLIHISEPTRPY